MRISVIWYFLILIEIGYTVYKRAHDEFWNTGVMASAQLRYELFHLAVSLLLITAIYGVLKNKAWAYSYVLNINAGLALASIGTTILCYLYSAGNSYSCFYSTNFIIGIISAALWALVFKNSSKKTYV